MMEGPPHVYQTGKLPPEALGRLLKRYAGAADRRVLVGPKAGEDAAAVRLSGKVLVVATDPITFAADRIGWYAVQVNANDVAVMGARPCWFQACLLLPPSRGDQIERIFRQIHEAAAALGVAVIGGHTEVTHDLPQPIVVGTMIGEVSPARLVRSSGARPGDDVVLTKGVAIEGAAIIAREKAAALKGAVPAGILKRARGFLKDPGISVVAEAAMAVRAGCRAMHDPTEGGVTMAAWELAQAAGCGIELDLAAVPVLDEAAVLCRAQGLDVYRTIASGALLIALPPARTGRLLAAYARAGVLAAVVGRMTRARRTVITEQGRRPLEPVPRDEITRIF